MGLFDSFNSPNSWAGWPQFGSIGQDLYQSQPSAAYQRLMGQMGLIGSQSAFGKYALGQRDDAYNTYLAKLGGMGGTGQDPTQYSYTDFLADWGPHLSSSFQDLSPSQRGERFPGGTPRARWIGWPS